MKTSLVNSLLGAGERVVVQEWSKEGMQILAIFSSKKAGKSSGVKEENKEHDDEGM